MIPLNNLPGPGGHVGGLLAPEHANTAGARVPPDAPGPGAVAVYGCPPRAAPARPRPARSPHARRARPHHRRCRAHRPGRAVRRPQGGADRPLPARRPRRLRPGRPRFRGATVPQIRAVVDRAALDDDKLERLVAGPWHEERMAALLIAVGRVKRLNRLLDRAQARPGSGTQTPPTVRDALAGREALGRRYLGWAARGAQAPRRRPTPGAWSTTATTAASTCPSPTPGDSSTRAPVASAGAVGSSLRRRRRRTPLPSKPHHHDTRHSITHPPQNPGRSCKRKPRCLRRPVRGGPAAGSCAP